MSSNFTHKNSFGCHSDPHVNETMTHECFSENVLLIPRISRQLVASENKKSVQNRRHIGRVAHDSNKIARNRLDTSQIKPQRRGTRYFCSRSNLFPLPHGEDKIDASSNRPCVTTGTRDVQSKIMFSKLNRSLPELRSQMLRARK